MSERIWHRPPRTPAHIGNSRRGLEKAYKDGAWGIDIDILMSRSGRVMACHWQRPMIFDGFYDPAGELPRTKKLRDMSGGEIARLRTRDAVPYRIHSASAMIRWNLDLAPKYHRRLDPLVLCFEVKPEPRFADPDSYLETLGTAAAFGVPVRIMTQPRGGEGLRYARAAKKAGAQVILLRRGRVGKDWLALLDEGDAIKHQGRLWTPEQAMRRGL